MTITFENDNDVIIYALEKVISYARRTQQIFVAQCVWWLASIIGLELGLVNYIDNIQSRVDVTVIPEMVSRVGRTVSPTPRDNQEDQRQDTSVPEEPTEQVHSDRVLNITQGRSVSAVPRDLTEDQRLDRILESAERVIQESFRDRTIAQQGRVNPLPTTKTQLKKARKIKRLQEKGRKQETERNQRLLAIRATVIRNLSKE
jgi:hypothetical protein